MPGDYEDCYVEKGSVDSADITGKDVCEAYHGHHHWALWDEEQEGGLFQSGMSLSLL